jgi:PAS domain S-box-containing protein
MGPQVERLLGFPPSDWIASPSLWPDRLHPEDRKRVLAEEQLAIVRGWPFSAEYRLIARDGREVWVHDEVNPLRDSEGASRYWRGVLLDITERRAAQQRIAVDQDSQAYELYDSATQSLRSAAALTQAICKLWQTEPTRAERKLAELDDLLQQTLAEMYALPLELRPEVLAELPLDQLLAQHIQAIQGPARTPIELTTGALRTLPTDVKITFYRVAQEVLNKVARPTRAKCVVIRLETIGDRLLMIAMIDGTGYRPEAMLRGRFGLRFLRERARAISARLEIRSLPCQQIEIRLTWPAERFHA